MHGSVEAENFIDRVKQLKTESEGGSSQPTIPIRLCGQDRTVRFTDRHLVDLQELMDSTKMDNAE